MESLRREAPAAPGDGPPLNPTAGQEFVGLAAKADQES
jgi:hypothetical protein